MTTTPLELTEASEEALPLAQQISRAVSQFLEVQAEVLDINPEDSLKNLEQSCEYWEQQALNSDPRHFSWMDFHALSKRDPDLAVQRWREVKGAAQSELQSGHRAADANDGNLTTTAWQRAQFLAIRDGLADEWKPQNGIERTLIDMMAQAFSTQLFWQERMMCFTCLESETENFKNNGCIQYPRMSDSQAVEQAAQMVDRFNRIFMRSLRALRDLRRHAPMLIVKNADQVNVSENQVNVGVTNH